MVEWATNKPRISVKGLGFFSVSCLITLFVLGCGLFDQEDHKVVILVGSRQITDDDLKKDLQFLSPAIDMGLLRQDRIRRQLVEQLIDHYLILEYGKERGIDLTDRELKAALKEMKRGYTEEAFNDALLRGYVDFEKWKDRLRELILANKIIREVTKGAAPPSYDEIKQYFKANQNEFSSPPMVRFRQIVTRTKEDGEALLKRLGSGEDMGELAREYSIGPEAERGGEVGWVAGGHLDESMEKVLFSLGPGKIGPIVETPYGYHIFEVMSVRPGGVRGLPDVIQEIEARMMSQRREVFFKKWLRGLRSDFRVDIDQGLLNTLELS